MDDDQCKNLQEFYNRDEVFKLMKQKSIYPYEYVDRFGKSDEKKLPWKDTFYSKLKMKRSSNQGYEHAQQI